MTDEEYAEMLAMMSEEDKRSMAQDAVDAHEIMQKIASSLPQITNSRGVQIVRMISVAEAKKTWP